MIRPQTCPVCKQALDVAAAPAQSRFFPFCSERCQQIDMYRWCTGQYAIVQPLDQPQLSGRSAVTIDQHHRLRLVQPSPRLANQLPLAVRKSSQEQALPSPARLHSLAAQLSGYYQRVVQHHAVVTSKHLGQIAYVGVVYRFAFSINDE